MRRIEGDKILNALLPFAKQLLAKQGAFFPFGAFLSETGQVNLVAAKSGNERPQPQALIELLAGSLRKSAAEEKYQATGVCVDVRVVPPGRAEKSEAIQVSIEYPDGTAVNVFLPYKKDASGEIQYGEIFASAAVPRIFTVIQ
jgi:hypothetical protein